MAVQGYAALEVEQAYARAQFLCNQVEDPAQLSQTLRGLWAYYLTRADLQTARTLAEQLLDLAQHEHNSALLLEADRELGQTLYFLGEFPRARQHLEQSLARYERQQHASHTVVYGQDPGVVCRSQGARTLWVLGYPDQAIQYLQAALSLGQEIAHPYSLALARYHATVVHRARGDVRMTREMAEATIALATEHGFLYWLSVARILRGWALVQQGQGELGLAEMLHGLADHLATGAELNRPYALALLAGAHGKVGQAKEGLVVLAEALTLVQKIGQHFHHAELYRLKGQLTLQKFQVAESRVGIAHQKVRIAEAEPVGGAHPTGEDEAEEYFHQAIEISRQQEAKSLELRATTSLARLWQQLGKKKEARQLLREIYAWFTEGFDTGDLKEAKALLEKLS
jgi:predicted ATPase